MKNRVLILSLIGVMSLQVQAFASDITTDDIMEHELLHNYGYSEPMIESVGRSRARANYVEYEDVNEESYENNEFVRLVRSFFMYMDPAYDDNSFMNHDIKTTPSANDL
ncbi:MAG: hypothetical protein R3Y28_06210 [Candidatus Gastranaerophilales bacterium]